MSKENDLRVWWIPQIPGKLFHTPVESIAEAKSMLDVLAKYDIFQFENKIKPDYCNTGGLEVLEDGEWLEWQSADDDNITSIEVAASSDLQAQIADLKAEFQIALDDGVCNGYVWAGHLARVVEKFGLNAGAYDPMPEGWKPETRSES